MTFLKTRQMLEDQEEKELARFACKAALSLGREVDEVEHEYRTCFQRDRDRIIHSKAFRRLEYKTQVFVNHEGDHYRTRLTHSLEVAQISRTVARILRVNEDLAETIALAHDLGHPPFGHSGEKAMNEVMLGKGGFEHNRQSLRIVTILEQRDIRYPGLNLSREVLEGLAKHFSEYDSPEGKEFSRTGAPSIEAQIANYCDEIAYNNHDLDDGLRSHLITLEQLSEVSLWHENYLVQKELLPDAPVEVLKTQTIRNIINTLVTDLIHNTVLNIQARGIETLEDVYQNGEQLVSFSDEIKEKNTELKRFLFSNLYRHWRVERMADKAGRVIKNLYEAYQNHPNILPKFVYLPKGEDPTRYICDYLAGMTDRFALEEYRKLFDPETKV